MPGDTSEETGLPADLAREAQVFFEKQRYAFVESTKVRSARLQEDVPLDMTLSFSGQFGLPGAKRREVL